MFFGLLPGTERKRLKDIPEDRVLKVVVYTFDMLLAVFFVYFSYDFFDDFTSGVYKNQGGVEYAKETYGLQVNFYLIIVLI